VCSSDLGTSLAETFPRQNRGLQERIAREHLLISQFPVGHPALAKNFPIRNRLMALVSDATIIIEAGETSGTRHQGWEAIRLKRPLFIMTCDPKWVQEMVDYGAQTPTEDELLEVIFDVVPTGNRDAVAL
jgi:DNA processing protein